VVEYKGIKTTESGSLNDNCQSEGGTLAVIAFILLQRWFFFKGFS